MHQVISKDGTKIAYDKFGSGAVLILVGGAFSERTYSGWVTVIDILKEHFTVINYDRRGRGDSGDCKPYAIEREIEDLEALINDVGGAVSLFGMSSGAVLALRAAASGLNIEKLVLYEPPFILDAARTAPANFGRELQAMVDAERRGDAVQYFMTKGMGVPVFFIWMMRFSPAWGRLKALAHTLPYDYAMMGDTVSGNPTSIEQWATLTLAIAVIDGEKSAASLRYGSQALAAILPNATYHSLEGQSHNVSMDVLASAIKENLQ